MISNIVYKKTYAAPPVCVKDILRYAGCGKADKEILDIIKECLCEIQDKLAYKVCWTEATVQIQNDMCDFGFAKIKSSALSKRLEGCKTVVFFAATVGLELDRCIAKYGSVSPVKSLVFQAIGTERIEALCDVFCADLAQNKSVEGTYLKPRFSPGYSDLSIEFQREIFNLLSPMKNIGLSLNSSMLMIPSKSVTAVVGITDNKAEKNSNKCASCNMTECTFRGK